MITLILLITLMSSNLNYAAELENALQSYFAINNQVQQQSPDRIKLHPAQQIVKSQAKRFNVLDCGRRFGKTKMLCDLLVETAAQGYPAGYFAPAYRYLMDGWRDLIHMTANIQSRTPDQQEKRIELTGGGVIECWSLDGEGAGGKKDYKAGRSRKYKRIVVDEAAQVPALEGIYDYAISPTLIDMKGDAWFGSTPNGKGAFYRMWRKGQINDSSYDPDWMSWQMPTSSNPYIPADEIERERRSKPDHVFRQEYLAEFLEDSGQVFRNISACTMKRADIWQECALPYHVYLIAWDLAKKEDFSVLGVIDCTTKRLVHMDRFNQVEYMLQIPRLIALAEKFQPVEVVVEQNGNLALMEVLRVVKYQKRGPAPRLSTSWYETDQITLEEIMLAEATMRKLEDATKASITHPATMPITEFVATNASKEEAIQALVLAFERGEISIPDDPILLGELEEFGMERLPSGRFRYSAPAGSHDDTVLMLGEGWYRARRYMSLEALPLREKAIRRLAPELHPDNIAYNQNESAYNSQEYHIHAYEREQKKKNTHFLNKYSGLGK
jgi:hypothetical protein